jgi:hypothetical protein
MRARQPANSTLPIALLHFFQNRMLMLMIKRLRIGGNVVTFTQAEI